MLKKIRINIFNKVFFFTASIAILIALFVLIISIRIESYFIENSIIHESVSLAETASKSIETGYFSNIWPLEILKKISENENVLFWWIVGPDGEIFLADDPESIGKIVDTSLIKQEKTTIQKSIFFKTKEKIKIVVSPIVLESKIKPWAFYLGVSEKPITVARNKILLNNSIVFFGSIILINLFSFLLTRTITQPIKKLRDSAVKISKGEFEKVKIKTQDEIEELADSFNQMIEDIQKYQSVMEETKAVLEIRVKARTRELEEFNKNLEQMVKERTKELQERIDELEKFHRLTVGRELKMLELKEEIEKLKTELKLKKKPV